MKQISLHPVQHDSPVITRPANEPLAVLNKITKCPHARIDLGFVYDYPGSTACADCNHKGIRFIGGSQVGHRTIASSNDEWNILQCRKYTWRRKYFIYSDNFRQSVSRDSNLFQYP